MLACVHLQTWHLGSNVFGKLSSAFRKRHLTPSSTTRILQLAAPAPPKVDHQGLLQEQIQPVLLCSLSVLPAKDTTDEMGHHDETCRLTCFFASRSASAMHISVQIMAADLPPPHILPSRNRVEPVSCCLGQGTDVTGGCGPRSEVVPDAAVLSMR